MRTFFFLFENMYLCMAVLQLSVVDCEEGLLGQANPRANQGDPQWDSMGCCHLMMFLHFRKWDLEAPPVPKGHLGSQERMALM